jgi:hypothetical protein
MALDIVCCYAKCRYVECLNYLKVMLSVVMLSVINSECRCAECSYTECRDYLKVMLSVVMLSIVMLNVVELNVVMLSVLVPFKKPTLQ